MTAREEGRGLKHQLGGHRVGELGEHHHHRAPVEPGGDGVQAQGVVGLLRRILQPRARHLQGRETAHAGGERRVQPQGGVEAGELDAVARVQAGVGQRQGGGERVIDPRPPVQRLGHAPAGVDGQHQRRVLLEPVLLDQELAPAGGALPGDHPPVVAGAVAAQGLELGPLPAPPVEPGAGGGGRQRRGGGPRRREVGRDHHLAPERRVHLPAHQAQRPRPAHLRLGDGQPTASPGGEVEGGCPVRHRPQARRGAEPLVHLQRRLQPGRRGGALEGRAHEDLAGAPQRQDGGRVHLQPQPVGTHGAQEVDQRRKQGHGHPRQPQRPQRRSSRAQRHGRRRQTRRQGDGPRRRRGGHDGRRPAHRALTGAPRCGPAPRRSRPPRGATPSPRPRSAPRGGAGRPARAP